MAVTGPRRFGRPRRRTARVRGAAAGTAKSHLDLENLLVALLAERGDAWPNALYRLGYRLHCFDTTIELLEPQDGGRLASRRLAPDAIAIEQRNNRALVLEAKTGTEVGFKQVPEGLAAPIEAWARAIAMPTQSLLPPRIQGIIVTADIILEAKVDAMAEKKVTWFRAVTPFAVDPCFLVDERVKPALEGLPDDDWPRSYVPFSKDRAQNGPKRVIAALAPHIISAAGNGQDRILASELVSVTHQAVWTLADPNTTHAWETIAAEALKDAAFGALKNLASYVPSPPGIRLHDVIPGHLADERTLLALRTALEREQRRTPRRAGRVPIRRAKSVDQIGLWPESD